MRKMGESRYPNIARIANFVLLTAILNSDLIENTNNYNNRWCAYVNIYLKGKYRPVEM